jgi:hypothetical protein
MESIYKSNYNAKQDGLGAKTKWLAKSGGNRKGFLREATLIVVENVSWK